MREAMVVGLSRAALAEEEAKAEAEEVGWQGGR